jgi:hypothetical protein
MTHVEVPDMNLSVATDFIDNWGLSWSPNQEIKELCERLNEIELREPPKEKLKSLSMALLRNLEKYNVSGRQIDTLLKLLTTSWTLEQLEFHRYSARDIGRLAASIVPVRMTKNGWEVSAEVLATTLTSGLADFPWEQSSTPVIKTASIAVEEIQNNCLRKTIKELIEIIKAPANELESFLAFEVMLHKMENSTDWLMPFDNYVSLLKQPI